MKKAPITTHILDLHRGKPAQGVRVKLYFESHDEIVAEGKTDEDGRISEWSNKFDCAVGEWRLEFDIEAWSMDQKRELFFTTISLNFSVNNTSEHYHVPLLLNEFGYTTYRGS